MDGHPISEAEKAIIEYSNLFFSTIFIMEMLIKLIALGVRNYIHDKMNVFDLIIAIVCVLDIIAIILDS
jgi:voltage-dependent calcium channel T type alpha-1H